MNQYKERIKRMRDKYNAEIAASFSFYDEPEYTAHLPFPPDDDEHVVACAETIADAYHNGHYHLMWEALTAAIEYCDDFHDELNSGILSETISELGWGKQPINTGTLDNTAFASMSLEAVTDPAEDHTVTSISTVTEALCEGGNVEHANSLTIMEHAASVILARTPPIGERDMRLFQHTFPFLRYQSVADFVTRVPGGQETSLTRLGGKILRSEALAGTAASDTVVGFVDADTGSVVEAAQWWRDAIARAEERGDGEEEAVARRAHAYACLTLMHMRALHHEDLAALIDSMQTPTTSGEQFAIIISEDFWISPIDTVGKLIDYSATRMSAAL